MVSRKATIYNNHGNSYDIDVFYEFYIAGVYHRVAIESKTLTVRLSVTMLSPLLARFAASERYWNLVQKMDSSLRPKISSRPQNPILSVATYPTLAAYRLPRYPLLRYQTSRPSGSHFGRLWSSKTDKRPRLGAYRG